MKKQENIYKMTDREFRSYKRTLRIRRERRQRIYFFILSLFALFCIVFFGAIALHSVRSSASNGFKYYTSVTVEEGDRLWNLVDDYIDYGHYKNKDSYIQEVRTINHLDKDCRITAGQCLIIPYYSDSYLR